MLNKWARMTFGIYICHNCHTIGIHYKEMGRRGHRHKFCNKCAKKMMRRNMRDLMILLCRKNTVICE